MISFAEARQIVLDSWPDYDIAEFGYDGGDYWLLTILPVTVGGRIPAVNKITGNLLWINENDMFYTQEFPISPEGVLADESGPEAARL